MSDLMARYRRGEPPGVFVFDCHAHMGRWIFPVFENGSAQAMVDEMDRLGVDAVALTHHACMGPSPSEGNRLAEQAIEPWPERFFLYCGYSPHYPDEGPAELERAFADPRYVGIKLHPSTHDTPIDDERYRPAFAFAHAHALPVLIHSWVGGGCRPELIGQVAADFPDATIILGHHGGAWAGVSETIEACNRQDNLVCDTCASELTYKVVDRLTAEIGTERVLFGSDLPFLAQGPQIGKVIYSRISDEAKAKVLGLAVDEELVRPVGRPAGPVSSGHRQHRQ